MSHPQNTIWDENKIELEFENPSLNQLYSLTESLLNDDAIQKHFKLDGLDEVKAKLENISLKEYKYILALIFDKRRTKLNLKLTQLNFKPRVLI